MPEKIIKIELTVYEALQLYKFHDDFLPDIKSIPTMVKLSETMQKFADQVISKTTIEDVRDAIQSVQINQLIGVEPPSTEGI